MTYLATFAMLCAAFSLEDDGKSLTLLDDGKPVFVYNYETVEPPRLVPEQQRRSCYIHPLYGLDGEIMTQDFPRFLGVAAVQRRRQAAGCVGDHHRPATARKMDHARGGREPRGNRRE